MEVEQSEQKQNKGEELDSYRGEKAREVAERVLLADGSNQHSASVQLVSARKDQSSTAARAPNTLLQTGGKERKEMQERTEKERSHRERAETITAWGGKIKLDEKTRIIKYRIN